MLPALLDLVLVFRQLVTLRLLLRKKTLFHYHLLRLLSTFVLPRIVFNITYPLHFGFVLLFLEKYIYGLKSSLKLSLSVTVLSDNLDKIAV